MNTVTLAAAAAIAFAALAGCATTTPVPADKLARTQAAINSAEQMGPSADPRALMHLELAKHQVAQAKGLMKNGDNRSAGLVLLRAEADAEAALNLARAWWAESDANRTMEEVRHLTARINEGRGS